MNNFGKFLSLGALLVVSAVAHATAISGSLSTTGANTFDQTQITFTPSTEPVLNATGTLAPYLPGTAVLSGFSFNSTAIGDTVFSVSKTINNVASVLSFTIDSTPILMAGSGSSNVDGSFIVVKGTGVFKETGYSDTQGTFTLSSTTSGVTSFNMNTTATAVTPEPNSIILLGSGIASATGMVLRRRRAV